MVPIFCVYTVGIGVYKKAGLRSDLVRQIFKITSHSVDDSMPFNDFNSPLSFYSIPVIWFTSFYPSTLKVMCPVVVRPFAGTNVDAPIVFDH